MKDEAKLRVFLHVLIKGLGKIFGNGLFLVAYCTYSDLYIHLIFSSFGIINSIFVTISLFCRKTGVNILASVSSP